MKNEILVKSKLNQKPAEVSVDSGSQKKPSPYFTTMQIEPKSSDRLHDAKNFKNG